MLRDLLCALGFACAPVQPDVSAHTILNMLVQTNGAEEFLLPALGSLYEEVQIVGRSQEGPQFIAVHLKRGQRSPAQLRCNIFREAAALDGTVPEKVAQHIARPVDGARSHCFFSYIDDADHVLEFMMQAEMWAEAHVGPLQSDEFAGLDEVLSAARPAGDQSLSVVWSGPKPVATATVHLVVDLAGP